MIPDGCMVTIEGDAGNNNNSNNGNPVYNNGNKEP